MDSTAHKLTDDVAHPCLTSVRLAKSSADFEMAARLRYGVYVREQSKWYPEADHARRLLADELDAESVTVLALAEGTAVGTIRANWLPSELLTARYGAIFQFERFARLRPEAISVSSRLAVAPQFRHNQARELLFETLCEIALARATRICFATCAGRLLRLFQSYGFREYAPPVIDATVGELHWMILILDDLLHLERVSSPFLKIVSRYGVKHTDRFWLNEILVEHEVRLPCST